MSRISATTLKFLRRKCFHKLPKIVAPQAHAQMHLNFYYYHVTYSLLSAGMELQKDGQKNLYCTFHGEASTYEKEYYVNPLNELTTQTERI